VATAGRLALDALDAETVRAFLLDRLAQRSSESSRLLAIFPSLVHAWESIGSEGLGYLNLRIDPMKMLRGGYTHPLLVK
jgi:hypothetical protein